MENLLNKFPFFLVSEFHGQSQKLWNAGITFDFCYPFWANLTKINQYFLFKIKFGT